VEEVRPGHPGDETAGAVEERAAVDREQRVLGQEPPRPGPEAVRGRDALTEVLASQQTPADECEREPEAVPDQAQAAVVGSGVDDPSVLPRVCPRAGSDVSPMSERTCVQIPSISPIDQARLFVRAYTIAATATPKARECVSPAPTSRDGTAPDRRPPGRGRRRSRRPPRRARALSSPPSGARAERAPAGAEAREGARAHVPE
jgi:hypothetical protein